MSVHVTTTTRGGPRRGWRASAVLAVLVIAGAAGFATTLSISTADPGKTGYPNSIASTGDSYTQGYQTCPTTFTDCPANSWATGTNGAVNSHYSRILAANSLINGNRFNDAVDGQGMGNLNAQVTNVNAQDVEYVTIMIGAADVCTSSEATMTDVATFTAQFQTAMTTLSLGSPDARIYVASIVDVYQIWSILHTNPTATSLWALVPFCPSMLANPTSMLQADVDRRANVRQRNMDFNAQLQLVCAQYIHCRSDGGAVFNNGITTAADISTVDYMHPSLAGQTRLASVSYGATFDFTDSVAPVSTASVTPDSGGISVELDGVDNVGLSGIEYRINASAWVRYVSDVFVPDGSAITFRAVDVNGNIEASQTVTTLPETPTPTATLCAGDPDCDGFLDVASGVHQGPANADTNADNCVGVANPDQLNSDGNFIDLSPPKVYDDKTQPNSDALGDACDSDDDNDGRSDAAESSGIGCAVTNPLDADSDGDNYVDRAECSIGTDPNAISSKPTQAQCGATTDADGDKLLEFREVCFYGTSPTNANTDGDACGDGREVGSINGDTAVSVVDLQQIATAIGPYALPGTAVQVNFDMTRDGNINVVDLQQAAAQIGTCP